MPQKNSFVKKGQTYRSLVATALIANGVFQFIAPVFAEGTKAGESISNTATATYEDPNEEGTTINATSNTVTVQVAEVAGVTVTPIGTEFAEVPDGNGGTVSGDTDGDGKIEVGDALYYNYKVTNVGNDPTKFRIPDQPKVDGEGELLKVNKNDGTPKAPVEVSYDGGTTWVEVTTSFETQSINPDESILVRVAVQIQNGAQSGDKIGVILGNTPGNAQNQPLQQDGNDLYTVDNTGTDNGDIDGDPINGVREASATQEITVDSDLKNYALATVMKTRTGHTVAGADGPLEDELTYELGLKVENTDTTGNGLQPAALEGITLNGLDATKKYILVSDAIPDNTKLKSVKVPAGWSVVYTTDQITTDANGANWTLSTEAGVVAQAGVTRVGFVKVDESISPGTEVTGFEITLEIEVAPATQSVKISNIAQAFGSSPDGSAVYDESGDKTPSNYNEQTQLFPGAQQPGQLPPNTLPNDVVDDGYINDDADLTAVGEDNNTNSGTGPNGEANVYTVTVAAPVSLLNGPLGVPDAVVDNDNNKDFTNKSSKVPANTKPGDKIDPDGVFFTNTVRNTGDADANITLLPTPPANPDDLPVGTEVTLLYDGNSKTYVYQDDGAGNKVFVPKDATPVVIISGVQPQQDKNYGVEVNLPPNTDLSTDIERGFPTPITTFVDTNTDGILDASEAQNITINRVYTGYLKMVKESRVIKNQGPDVLTGQDNFDTTPGVGDATNDVERTPAPGNILEYRIRYKNISSPQAGTGNVVLNANKVEITEDGTDATLGNNWALDNDNNGEIDTSNIIGSAKDSAGGNVEFYNGSNTVGNDISGTTATTDVTKYVVKLPDPVQPGVEENFVFQRLINGEANTGN